MVGLPSRRFLTAEGKVNQNRAPLSGLAFHADFTAVGTDNFLGDIKPKSGALVPRFGDSVKFFKDSFLIFFWNSRAGISYSKTHGTVDGFRT